MNKKRLVVVGILVVIAIILLVLVINLVNKDSKKKNENKSNVNVYENVNSGDASNLNESNIFVSKDVKIEGVRKIGKLEFSNISYNKSAMVIVFKGKLSNNTDVDADEGFANCKILDDKGNIIDSKRVLVGKLKAGGSRKCTFMVNSNLNSKDIEIHDVMFTD